MADVDDVVREKRAKKFKDEQWEVFEAEQNAWNLAELPHPKNVFEKDDFILICRMEAFRRVLLKLGIILEDELTGEMHQVMAEKLAEARPLLIQAKAQGAIAQLPRLFGPNGEVLH